MAQQDPSSRPQAITYRPAAGFRRVVQATHPGFGSLALLTTDVSLSDSTQANFTKYAATPGFGAKQKTIHTAGTKELSWSIKGEVTAGSLGLLALMHSSARGVGFRKILVSQGTEGFLFNSPFGSTLPWGQMSINGNQNAGLEFNLEGKSTILPEHWEAPETLEVDEQIPSWTTGNDLVVSWSISHNVNLAPHWFNTDSMFPGYYRAGESEFTVQVSTAVALREHTAIRIGYGGISIAEMVCTSRTKTFGDRNSPATYQASSTNARLSGQNGYTDFVDIVIGGIPESAYYR